MVKIDKYRQLAKKELEGTSIEASLPLLTSRARRALKRAMEGKNIDFKKLIKKVAAIQAKNALKDAAHAAKAQQATAAPPAKDAAGAVKAGAAPAASGKDQMPKAIKTRVRAAVVLPNWVGLTFGIYSGKEYKNVLITPDKIGYRLGDFMHTTGRVLHSGPGIGATRGSKFIPLK